MTSEVLETSPSLTPKIAARRAPDRSPRCHRSRRRSWRSGRVDGRLAASRRAPGRGRARRRHACSRVGVAVVDAGVRLLGPLDDRQDGVQGEATGRRDQQPGPQARAGRRRHPLPGIAQPPLPVRRMPPLHGGELARGCRRAPPRRRPRAGRRGRRPPVRSPAGPATCGRRPRPRSRPPGVRSAVPAHWSQQHATRRGRRDARPALPRPRACSSAPGAEEPIRGRNTSGTSVVDDEASIERSDHGTDRSIQLRPTRGGAVLARIRVRVPDRPGSLGRVASAIGAASGDIAGVDVLDSEAGQALDDVVVRVRDAAHVRRVLDGLALVPGVSVEGVHSPEPPATGHADLQLVAQVLARPARALQTLVDGAPAALGVDWAAIVQDPGDGPAAPVLSVSTGAPEHLRGPGRVPAPAAHARAAGRLDPAGRARAPRRVPARAAPRARRPRRAHQRALAARPAGCRGRLRPGGGVPRLSRPGRGVRGRTPRAAGARPR